MSSSLQYQSQHSAAAYGSRFTERSLEQFPDPFMDAASLVMPETINDALAWTEFILSCDGTYREALRRHVSYFVTEVEVVDDIGREEKKKWLDIFHDDLKIQRLMQTVNMDFACYGNGFEMFLTGMRRYLVCGRPGCGFNMPLHEIASPKFGYKWSGYKFYATCPQCHYSGQFNHRDLRSHEVADLRLNRLSVFDMELLHDPFRGDTDFIWKIPQYYRDMIREGHVFQLERANWEVVEAIRDNQNLRLGDDVIYHLKEDALCGIQNRGWGISRVLANFRLAWYVQVLRRYNEAIALDYIIPFRVLTPDVNSGSDPASIDPAIGGNLGQYTGALTRMLKARRRDPARWNVLPFPVKYQALGGEASALAPKDLLELGRNDLLAATGIPLQLWNGDLTSQALYPALRLYEASNNWLIDAMNSFINYLGRRVAKLKSWEPVRLRWRSVSLSDDIQRQMAKLQLTTAREISRTTGFKMLDLDFEEEQRRIMEEEKIIAKNQAKLQKDMEQQATMDMMAQPATDPMMGGGAPAAGGMPPAGGAGGAPAAGANGATPGPQAAAAPGMPASVGAMQYTWMRYLPGPNEPISLEDMQQRAQMIADDLFTKPESQKDSELIQLKRKNESIHALVSSIMEDKRRQYQVQAGAQAMAQAYGKAAAAGILPLAPHQHPFAATHRICDVDD